MPSAFRIESVGSEVKTVVSFNPNRKLLMIINESEYIVYISKDPQNVANVGIALYPYESIVFDVADGDEPEYAFFAQCLEGVAIIRIYENLVM
ncbi:MAG: hypothetical protein QXW58_06085 [Thermosphaera sp.]